jgi:hypothetical protein
MRRVVAISVVGIAILKGIAFGSSSITEVLIDTTINQYGLWTTVQDPIISHGDTVIFFNKLQYPGDTAALGLIYSVDDFSSHIKDWPLGSNMSERPSAVLHPFYPAGVWAEMIGYPSPGNVGAGNEPDYISTGFCSTLSPLENIHTVLAKTRSDGRIVGLASDVMGNCYSFVYDPSICEFIQDPTVVPQLSGFEPMGLDYYGIYMTFGCLSYSTSSDGVDWLNPQSISPPGFPTTGLIMGFCDGVIGFDGGTPYFVLDYNPFSTSDTLLATEVWFATPDTAIRVDVNLDTYNHYPQLVIDRENEVLYVVWAEANSNVYDPQIEGYWWDIYWSYSLDQGLTWSTPENLTSTPDVNECMPHVSRLPGTEKIWLVFATTLDATMGDLYSGVYFGTGFDLYPTSYHIGYIYPIVINISEGENGEPKKDLIVRDNRKLSRIEVSFLMGEAGNARITMYDLTGRRIYEKEGYFGRGVHRVFFSTKDLASGYYFIRLSAPKTRRTARVLHIR